jgi:hypothetical protein
MSSHSQSNEATTFLREIIASAGLFGIIFLALVLLPSGHATAPAGGGAASSVMTHMRATRAMPAHTPCGDFLERCEPDVQDEMADTLSAEARATARSTALGDDRETDEC